MDTNTLSSNIRSARLRANLSQAELAKILSKSQTTVAAWETGRSQPDASTIVRLCDTLNVSSDYLLGLTNSNSIIKEKTVYDEILNAIGWILTFSDMGLIVPHIVESESSNKLQYIELKGPLNKLLLVNWEIQELKKIVTPDLGDYADEVTENIDDFYSKLFSTVSKTLLDLYLKIYSSSDSHNSDDSSQ